ncbi:hypothetical protein [Rhodopseudomonas palustris]|uniref:Uncharacterized protein n=1 Tax=Rhodopseudomonas palustris TaxID=1076 RepID=A0A418V1L4_RHOPL|nr:hypothetical protein [Rhodopseudomonas palustris]RJF69796.1 hypothetical protein D4Q52_19320 [Rhodopseudomonas palustris]
MRSDKEDKARRSDTARQRNAHADELLDEALRETFPASDPIAVDVPEAHGVRPKPARPRPSPKRKT